MITSRQVRAARALLGWTQELLADKALVALTALKRLESDRLLVRDATLDAVRKALEAAGIVFLSSGRGEGAMLVRQETKDFPLLPICALPAPARDRPRSGPEPIRATEAGAAAAPIYCGPDDDPSRRELAPN